MCGRYSLHNKRLVKSQIGCDINPDYNICPKKKVLIFNDQLVPCRMTWGYSPVWSKRASSLINARLETLAHKPSFKGTKRCIFIASGYYEWRVVKDAKFPYYHYCKDKLMYFAGIYNETSGCCIVTRPSDEKFSFIHDRQPCLIEESGFDDWLKNRYDLSYATPSNLAFYQVSKKVNSPVNNDETILRELI